MKRPEIRRGDVGKAVLEARRMLAARGYLTSHPNSSHFGELMERQTCRFQARAGLTVDGVIGRRTWDELTHKPEHHPWAIGEAGQFALVVKQRVTGKDGHPRPEYRLGAEVTIKQRYPGVLDCSETVQFGCGRVVNDLWVDGSWIQAGNVKPISVSEAKRTIGSLVFLTDNNRPDGHVHHVGVVAMDGKEVVVAQARSAYLTPECGIWPFDEQPWALAGRIPILRGYRIR